MRISSDWVDRSGRFDKGTEGWSVAPSAEGFTPNVNVLTQNTKDLSLDDYIDLSKRNAARILPGSKFVGSSVVRGTDGN